MDDYITKPVVTEDLAAMLARWIDPVDPAAHAGAAGPAVVVSVLDDLRVFQSDEGSDILVELIGIFLEDTPPRLTTLVDAVAGGDASAAEASAHALKSSCAQLGALGLSELCRQVELACKQGSVSETGPIIDQIQVEFRRVEIALEALRSPV
jgi:HPt (histidine-containing phosphotransfer) domain-containing protein